jgi:ligand-binding sensor domain-containing protein/serine phosphatase RsbU (regulator of sigma subunit)
VLLWAPALFLLSASALAQENYEVRQFDESNGLSSNFVNAITQAESGHLIVANKGGIERFDGKSFEPIKAANDTNPLGFITSLYKTEDEIWFGKFDGNIGVIDSEVSIIETGINGKIKHIYKDSRDGIWAFSRSGMVFWANGNDTNRYDMAERDLLVNDVIPYKHKEFLVGSNDGLWLIRFEDGTDFQVLRQVEGLPETRVTSLYFESDHDRLWVGTEDAGLHIVSSPFTVRQSISEFKTENGNSIDDVQSIFVDKLKRIWLGTFGNGLRRIEYLNEERTEFYIQVIGEQIDEDYLIREIFQDNEENIWIATFGGGIVQVVENVFHHPFDENWLKEQSITQLYRDSKFNIWLGIDKGVFKTAEYSRNSKYKYYHVGGNKVTAIAEDDGGNVWLGTEDAGLFKYSASQDQFTSVNTIEENLGKAINNILIAKTGIYVSTKAGLLIYNSQGELVDRLTTLSGLPHNNVKYCFEDSAGSIWIACQGNRICYLWKNEIRFIESNADQTIVDVTHIIEDNQKRLWFATMGQGLSVLSKGTVTNLNTTNELPSDYCYQLVLDDDQNVWVSHQKSLTRISPELKRSRTVSKEDLTNTENSMVSFLFKDKEGSIWISSTHSVVKFKPAIDKSSKSEPQLSITSMLVDGVRQDLAPNLTLEYRKYDDITFELAGISLRQPDGITYKYQVKGLFNTWKEQSSDKISIPGIGHGTYEIIVYASKNGGDWTKEPVSFKFSIAKPYWLSWWFWTLLLVAVLLGFVGFVRYRTFRLVRDKEELEEVVRERTVEIQEQKSEIERSRDEIAKYAKDITDSIKYAKRIQKAIFPAWQEVRDTLPESMVFFRSKDLVSGDFYFAERIGSKRIFAAVDCTGHGVPGGFMSIVANNLLQQAIKQVGLTKPSEILDYASHGITNTLHQTIEESSVKDGMDVALCCWDEKTNTLEYAGAYNPLYIFRDGNLMEFKANRFPVGTFIGETINSFTNHEIQLQKGDMIYVFTDGFADQFGGANGKKFMMNRFRKLLTEIHLKPIEEQSEILEKTFNNWKGNLDQVDDICVVGVRVTQ